MKVLLFSALLAFASSNLIDKLTENNWTAVMVFPMVPITKSDCTPIRIEATNLTCKCGDDEVPVVKLGFNREDTDYSEVIVVKTHEEVVQALQEDCSDCGKRIKFVARYINDNYFLMYMGHVGTSSFMLSAKEVPAYAEIEKTIKSIDVTKDIMGIVVCTNETRNEV